MAGGAVVPVGAPGKRYNGRVTAYVIWSCVVAASGGLLFGYDIGVTGGVTSMPDFQKKFFPSVYRHRSDPARNAYCQYDSQTLQLFTSSLFLAGMVSSFVGSWITRRFGRTRSMLVGGLFFLLGAGLVAGAANLPMLVVGRVCLGVGVGMANQSVPLYLSEISPTHLRGAFNIMFQLATTLGILAAQLINYGTKNLTHGWRISLGLAAVPAILLTIGGLVCPETANNLVDRGKYDQAQKVLKRVRGTDDIHEEYNDIVAASHLAQTVKHPWRNLLKPAYRPQLTNSILIPAFQQLTGINAIMFYAPVLFSSLGFGTSSALLQAVIIGAVNVVATFVSILTVDRLGRKILFLEGGIQMSLALIATAIILGIEFSGEAGTPNLPTGIAVLVLVVICIFVSAFAWSWGPLGWLVPSEIQPLETRSAGQAVTVTVNFLLTFIIGQVFLSMLCAFKWGTFVFFAGWVVIMTFYVQFFLPETKGVALEDMTSRWYTHPFWKRYAPAGFDQQKVKMREMEYRTDVPAADV
eukprot:jgi/Chlat1/4615/Chrsp293S04361